MLALGPVQPRRPPPRRRHHPAAEPRVLTRLRAARPGDAELIAGIQERSATVAYAHIFGGEPYPTDATRRRWRNFDGSVAIAEVDGRAVGFVAWRGAALDALYVLPDSAARGIGSRLLDRAGPVSTLWVLEANRAARRFYERRGWAPDGTARVGGGGRRELRYVRQP